MTPAIRHAAAPARRVPARRLLLVTLGFGIWCAALVVLYALHHVGCAFGWPANLLRLGLAVSFLAPLAAVGVLWRRHARAEVAAGRTDSFLRRVTAWTLAAAFVTLAFTLGPALFLTTCA
jgi:hypothetical protein